MKTRVIDYSEVSDGILAVVEKETPILLSLPEDIITERLNCQNRSIKMLIGHMIDSASNNQQRMVRLQYARINSIMGDKSPVEIFGGEACAG